MLRSDVKLVLLLNIYKIALRRSIRGRPPAKLSNEVYLILRDLTSNSSVIIKGYEQMGGSISTQRHYYFLFFTPGLKEDQLYLFKSVRFS